MKQFFLTNFFIDVHSIVFLQGIIGQADEKNKPNFVT